MNLAKISANGQLTVPIEVRKLLNVHAGDKVLFFKRDGDIVMRQATSAAIIRAQKNFLGSAQDFGVESEEDVQRLVDEVRYGTGQ